MTNTDNDTLTNVIITPDGSLQGGTLDGRVSNAGSISDVTLGAGARVNGGSLGGRIIGDPMSPAVLNSTSVTDGTVLENVVVNANTSVSPNAVIGRNVKFEDISQLPAGLDLTGALNSMAVGDQNTMGLDLNSSLQQGDNAETILDQLRIIEFLNSPDSTITQNENNAALLIENPIFVLNVLPVSIRQVGTTVVPGSTVNSDGDITIVTPTGQEITTVPVLVDVQSFQQTIGGLPVSLDGRTNIVVSGLGSSNSGQSLEAVARPDIIVLNAADGSTAGLQTSPNNQLINVITVSFIFEDANGDLKEQRIIPVPQDWPELRNSLLDIAAIENLRISTQGIISLRFDGAEIRALADYIVTRSATIDSTPRSFQVVNAGDLNGDGQPDFRMTFSNGDTQTLYILPPR